MPRILARYRADKHHWRHNPKTVVTRSEHLGFERAQAEGVSRLPREGFNPTLWAPQGLRDSLVRRRIFGLRTIGARQPLPTSSSARRVVRILISTERELLRLHACHAGL